MDALDLPAAGQTGGTNSAVNKIVGVTSFGYVQPKGVFLAASSILDQRFIQIYNQVCAHRAGNCKQAGGPF